MAAIYGKDELGLKNETLMGTLLLVQFVGICGALLFSYFSKIFGTKRILTLILFLWLGILCYAYLMTSPLDFWILGITVGLVLGGSQALSRSMYGSMVPTNESAEFFGYYSVFAKIFGYMGSICVWHYSPNYRNVTSCHIITCGLSLSLELYSYV